MPANPEEQRARAMEILEKLLCCLFSLRADHFYSALLDDGFSEEEAGLLAGPCMRTAASRRWMTKTPACVPSNRNHSNLQRVWASNLHKPFAAGGVNAQKEIREAYGHWEKRGMEPPDELAAVWRKP